MSRNIIPLGQNGEIDRDHIEQRNPANPEQQASELKDWEDTVVEC